MKKTILCCALAIAVAFTFTACGAKKEAEVTLSYSIFFPPATNSAKSPPTGQKKSRVAATAG